VNVLVIERKKEERALAAWFAEALRKKEETVSGA
jgi:hypothetical protein